MPPPIGPPVLKRYASFPLAASSTRKSPVSSPVITTPPADVVAAATIGRGERSFHFNSPRRRAPHPQAAPRHPRRGDHRSRRAVLPFHHARPRIDCRQPPLARAIVLV